MKKKSFEIKHYMVEEHPKLYQRLNIGIYCLFIPVLLIIKLFGFLGCLSDNLEDCLARIRRKIITFIFKKIYRK